MSEETVYKIETSDKTDFLYAIHGLDFLSVIRDLDQELRNRIKYVHDHEAEDAVEIYEEVRKLLRVLMEDHNVTLNMLV